MITEFWVLLIGIAVFVVLLITVVAMNIIQYIHGRRRKPEIGGH